VTEYRESTHARQWGVGWGPKFIRAVGHTRPAGPLRRLIVRGDRALYRITGGKYLWSATVRIRTLALLVNSPQGSPFVVPLQYVVVDSEIYVLGTNWGRPQHPRWTQWLLVDGRCAVNIRGRERPAQARLVEGAERAALWPRILDVSAYYARAQRISNRQLRIFHLEIDD
jgi:deazaflavin-dependent oxidoreductase (nitroreductase family)